jgi:hypothetical protein
VTSAGDSGCGEFQVEGVTRSVTRTAKSVTRASCGHHKIENPGTNVGLRLHPGPVCQFVLRSHLAHARGETGANFNATGPAEHAHDIACFGRLWRTKAELPKQHDWLQVRQQ